MNPLFLLFGLFGLNAAFSGGGGSTGTGTTGTATGAAAGKKDDKVVDTSDKDDTTSDPVDTADPVVIETPDPVEDETPEPVEDDTPDPVEDETPDPVEDNTPDPVEDETPNPVEDNTPDPTPDPVEDDTPDPVEDNTPDPTPDPGDDNTGGQPGVVDPTPDAPDQTGGSGSDGGGTTPIIADGSVQVMAGRVATLTPEANGAVDIQIVSGVEHGNITVNPDNTFALVMTNSEFTGNQSFTYEATYADGSTSTHQVGLNVTEGAQAEGWGTSRTHYMLETDENDNIIVEHGENHTKVYISGSNSALSRADIANMEGLSTSQITGEWLATSQYGRSEDLALDQDAGELLWDTVTPRGSSTSNHLLLERGYQYDEFSEVLMNRNTHGESEMNPLYLGAWGEGERPELTTEFRLFQDSTSNLVVQDISFTGGVFNYSVHNVIYDNVEVTGAHDMVIQNATGVTVRNSEFVDIVRSDPEGELWNTHSARIQGLFMNHADGVLIEGNFFDHIGWEDGYDPDRDGDQGMPPSQWSHNIYLSTDMTDVTLRDTISMRSASYGAMVRSGGFIEDNAFIDNNAALTYLGGDYNDRGPVGEYTLMADNVITSGAHKDADFIGGLTLGILDRGELTTRVDNIVTHLSDPNNPSELLWKIWTHNSIDTDNPAYYDDTIVYNWEGSREIFGPQITEQNVDGLDTNVLDQTTIQLFTAQLLGDPNATISDLADYLREQNQGENEEVVDADLIVQYFQDGFGISADIRDAQTLTFVPDDLGEGIRWDNRLNWDAEDLPGLYEADSVDLNGNYVDVGTTTTIDTAEIGDGGTLNVYGGRLTLNGGLTGDAGTLNVEGSGQIWTDGSDANDLDVDVEGGRFANTGTFSGADLTAAGGQVLLAVDDAEYEVEDGDTLTIDGSDARVGFDGESGGLAVLDLHDGGTVAFNADSNGLGMIAEFRSGALEDTPDVQSGIDLGNSTLEIDLAGLSAADGNQFTLMDADEIVGLFDDASVDGLGSRNATIVINYETDSVTLQLSSGNGQVTIETVGEQDDVTSGSQALWNALTADQGVISETSAGETVEDDMVEAA